MEKLHRTFLLLYLSPLSLTLLLSCYVSQLYCHRVNPPTPGLKLWAGSCVLTPFPISLGICSPLWQDLKARDTKLSDNFLKTKNYLSKQHDSNMEELFQSILCAELSLYKDFSSEHQGEFTVGYQLQEGSCSSAAAALIFQPDFCSQHLPSLHRSCPGKGQPAPSPLCRGDVPALVGTRSGHAGAQDHTSLKEQAAVPTPLLPQLFPRCFPLDTKGKCTPYAPMARPAPHLPGPG